MDWRLLPMISAHMPLQMALDELLFEDQIRSPQAPALRFYSASAPWISAGCSFRRAEDLANSSLVLENPRVPVCRRLTGGGCVLHGSDLIFALIARYGPENDPLNSVRTSYGKIHEGVKIALRNLGAAPDFYTPQDPLPKGKDCFRFPVESDLSWKGRKIAGGAQKRSRGVLLHQESIQMPGRSGHDALIVAILGGLAEVFGITVRKAVMDPELVFQAERKALPQGGQSWKNSEVT